MDMRSLEHCLNDITNTPGVQSDLKGELLFFILNLIVSKKGFYLKNYTHYIQRFGSTRSFLNSVKKKFG